MLQNCWTLAVKIRMEWDVWQVGGVLLLTFIQVGGVAEKDLRTLVDFMYHGQLEVRHRD